MRYAEREPFPVLRLDRTNVLTRLIPARILLALLAAAAIGAETVDRIAVSVGNLVITTSELERQIRTTAFLNGKPPDFSPASKRATADRMVEQMLIRRELENGRYPLPSAGEIEPVLEKFVRDNFGSAADYQKALVATGLSEQDLKDELLWQRRLLLFVGERFRAGVYVSDQQIQDYFEKIVRPAAALVKPGQPVEIEDYRAGIEDTLAGPRVDQAMDSWLQDVRKRTDIVYHEEALR